MKASRKCVLLAYALEDQNNILQSCSNFTSKLELEPTLIACLAEEILRRFGILDLSKHRAVIQSDRDSCQTSAMPIFTRPPFPQKHIPSCMN